MSQFNAKNPCRDAELPMYILSQIGQKYCQKN
jgi:hypothetical protein